MYISELISEKGIVNENAYIRVLPSRLNAIAIPIFLRDILPPMKDLEIIKKQIFSKNKYMKY